MERNEQSRLLKRPGDDGVQFEGFEPILTGEMTMQLSSLYLRQIGEYTFLRKFEEKSMDARDINNTVEFLIEHRVQPTKDNVFRLWIAARLDLILDAKRPGWLERLAHYGQE
jgi:hypothetical protein